MNNELKKVILNNHLHPLGYQKIRNVYIIKDKDRSYVIKLNTNNYDIYKYLISRDFFDFPENFNKKNDNYDLSEYIEEIKIEYEQKVNDLLEEIALLHKKTSYKRELDLDNIKKIYESIKEDIVKSKNYYYNLNDGIDKNIFFSPSMYLLIRNISLLYYLLEYSEKEIDKWYQSIQKEKGIRVCLLHNNISLEHLIINENKYLINWDKSYFGNPVNDIVSFYKKYYQNLSLEEVLKIYENKNKLSNLEKELLLIKLSLPERIILTKDTFNDTKLINDELFYLTKIYDYVKKSD